MDTTITQAIIIALLPLTAFVIQIFIGKRLPRQGDWLCAIAIVVAFLLSLTILGRVFSVYDASFKVVHVFDWVSLGTVNITFGIHVDNITAIMLFVVTLVSSLVHFYSMAYLHGDIRYNRYFAFLSLFTFSMLGLILVDNFLGIYIFWELVGLCSYFLIGHWFEKKSASDAAKKAFLVNRVGDIGMFTGIMIIFATLGTFNFSEVFQNVADGNLAGGWLTAAGILVFMGAVGKSAQFPLHIWLPDAMEGPTPVSALIHAATMVAAGVYMVGRTYAMYTADALLVIAVIGTITAFMAATIAMAQMDIKKVLAYSTVSQLGFMIAALGVGGYSAGLFHLMTHAFFKALLFLGSGSVIHAMHHSLHKLHDHDTDPQDMRNMGGLRAKMPITFVTMGIATLAISGVPGLSGFFSKDAILAAALEKALTTHSFMHWTILVMLALAAGLTAFYMFRLLYLTFFGKPAREMIHEHLHESPAIMTVPLIVLAILSIVGGWGSWFTDLVQKPEVTAAGAAALHMGEQGAGHDIAHTAHNIAMTLSIIIATIGILLSTLVYLLKKISADEWENRCKPVYTFFQNKWYFDELYSATIIAGTLAISRGAAWFDTHIIDGLVNGVARITVLGSYLSGWTDTKIVDGLVNLIANGVGRLGSILREVQTGRVQSYILMALGAVVVLYILQLSLI